MAWRVYGGTINPGQSIRFAFWWDRHAYQGIQVVQARPIPTTAVDLIIALRATLKTTDPSVKQEVGPIGYTYVVTVTHVDGSSTEYELVGQRVGD